MNGDGEPEYMKPNALMETGSVFGSSSEDEEENDHRQLRQEQPEREDA
eukprot:COSAG01_NODE_63985_length_278_cov_0.581006_2_plen_47_part_01